VTAGRTPYWRVLAVWALVLGALYFLQEYFS